MDSMGQLANHRRIANSVLLRLEKHQKMKHGKLTIRKHVSGFVPVILWNSTFRVSTTVSLAGLSDVSGAESVPVANAPPNYPHFRRIL